MAACAFSASTIHRSLGSQARAQQRGEVQNACFCSGCSTMSLSARIFCARRWCACGHHASLGAPSTDNLYLTPLSLSQITISIQSTSYSMFGELYHMGVRKHRLRNKHWYACTIYSSTKYTVVQRIQVLLACLQSAQHLSRPRHCQGL